VDLSVLTTCPLFHGVNEEELSAMLSCLDSREHSYTRGELIFREGEPADRVGIVLEGNVQIFRNDYDGSRSLLGRAGVGDLFGEVFACAGMSELPVSVEATQDSVILLADCKRVLTVCRNACSFHNRLINNLLQAVAEKNLQLNRKIECMSRRTTREKLMVFLLGEAKAHNSREFDIPFDRQQMADYLNLERTALSKELRKMKDDGLIDFHKNSFHLKESLEL
jgi:CRP-like cAMP-binding protein